MTSRNTPEPRGAPAPESNRRYMARLLAAGVLAYTLWIATGALALAILPLTRVLILRLVVALDRGRWSLTFWDQIGFVVVVLVWLALALYTENRYRRAIPHGFRAIGAVAARTLPVVIGLAAAEAVLIWALR
jgi:hypothetical protein